MNVSKTQYDSTALNRYDISSYMLALPKAEISGFTNVECNSLYYIIDSNWDELSEKWN